VSIYRDVSEMLFTTVHSILTLDYYNPILLQYPVSLNHYVMICRNTVKSEPHPISWTLLKPQAACLVN